MKKSIAKYIWTGSIYYTQKKMQNESALERSRKKSNEKNSEIGFDLCKFGKWNCIWFHKIDHKAVNQLHRMTINYILFGKQVHLRKWSFNKTDGNMASKKRRSN